MARVILSFLFLFFLLSANAQRTQEAVYLKNGSILRGTIHQSDSIIKVEILGGSVFVYPASDVIKIETEDFYRVNLKGPRTIQKNGWYTEFSFGLPIGLDQWGWITSGVTLNGFLGYQFKPIVKTGLGTGIDWYNYEAAMIPFFARITGDLTTKNTTPFYLADIGYAVNVSSTWGNEDHFGGFLMHLGGGFKFNTRKKHYYNFSVGYKTQFTSSYYFQTWIEEPYWEYRQFNRIEGRLAIGF